MVARNVFFPNPGPTAGHGGDHDGRGHVPRKGAQRWAGEADEYTEHLSCHPPPFVVPSREKGQERSVFKYGAVMLLNIFNQ